MRILIGIVIAAIAAGLIAWWQLCPQCVAPPRSDPPPAPAPTSDFVIYQHLNAPVTGYRGINEAGDIVGYFQDTPVETTAHALLMRAGAPSMIDPPSTRDRRAFGINDPGLIALSFDGRNAVLWDGAAYTPVAYPGASGTVVRGLNNHGDVVGEYTDSGGVVRAFVRFEGVFIALDFPDAARASVRGVNDTRHAVGYVEAADRSRRCFVRAPDGAITMLDYPGAAATMCGDINTAGVIVGGWMDAGGRLHGFIRAPDGSFRTFDVPEAQDTLPLGINEAGDIVGEATFGGRYGDYTIPHRAFFTSAFR